MAPAPDKDAGAFFWSRSEEEQPVSDHFRADPFEDPQSNHPQGRGGGAAPDRSPEDDLDWQGVLERVREEFRSGRAPDGVQRTFR
jgi:hypothetical protein